MTIVLSSGYKAGNKNPITIRESARSIKRNKGIIELQQNKRCQQFLQKIVLLQK